MANNKLGKNHEKMKNHVLLVSAKLFLEQGYTNTTLREITAAADINLGSLINLFRNKEDILAALVEYVLEGQFTAAAKMLAGKTDDKILFYAAETTLQLYMAESSEHIRDLYSCAYSLPKSMDIIQHTITAKLEDIFREHLPNLETADFYKLEIASGGVMRAFMAAPCTIWFPMEQKVEAFLQATFKIYDVPQEKIAQAVAFVSQIDYKSVAQMTIDNMMDYLGEFGMRNENSEFGIRNAE